jgi:hypothetical protein
MIAPVIHQSMGSRDYLVRWDTNHMGITLIICYQIELDKLSIYKTLTCNIVKMCC